jgi:hypothetical protein
MGFVEVLEDRGRGRSNSYIPHRIEPIIRVPSGLWGNDWIARLSGAALLALLRLFACQQEPIATTAEFGRTPAPVRALARRGQLLVEADRLHGLDPTGDATRRGLAELRTAGLVSGIRARSGGFYVVLDQELLRRPAQ